MRAEVGDKVRVKKGSEAGKRGIVSAVHAQQLSIRLDEGEKVVKLAFADVTNYSLAARKAWQTEPDRSVGRRRGSKTTDRISVTLRIDRDIWDEFQAKEESGKIEDRTATINAWLREKLAELSDRGGEENA